MVVLDAETVKRVKRYTNGLKAARNYPLAKAPEQLDAADPYVLFYRDFKDSNGEPVMSLSQARVRAYGVYENDGLEQIAEDAMILALLSYTTFKGDMPTFEDEDESDDERYEAGLPPALKRGMWSPVEQKLNYLKELAMTDKKFERALGEAVQEAVAEAKRRGMITDDEEEKDPDGFHGEPAS
jgi:hypothetical protein